MVCAQDEEKPALGSADLQLSEMETLLKAGLRENAKLKVEVERLRAESAELEVHNKFLEAQVASQAKTPAAKALVASEKRAEDFRVRYRDLLLTFEGLGLASVGSEKELRERLMVAVRERQQMAGRNEDATEQLIKLSEAVSAYLKTASSSDIRARLEVEGQIRKVDDLIGASGVKKHEAKVIEITDGRVVAFKNELNLAVFDIGRQSGVHVGMPVNIMRKDRLVATALVVRVYDTFCGALIENVVRQGDVIRVRDQVEPRTTQVNF